MKTCCGAKSQVALLLGGMKSPTAWKSFCRGFSKPRQWRLSETRLEKRMGYMQYGTPIKSFANTLLLTPFQIRYKPPLLYSWLIQWESADSPPLPLLCLVQLLQQCFELTFEMISFTLLAKKRKRINVYVSSLRFEPFACGTNVTFGSLSLGIPNTATLQTKTTSDTSYD